MGATMQAYGQAMYSNGVYQNELSFFQNICEGTDGKVSIENSNVNNLFQNNS